MGKTTLRGYTDPDTMKEIQRINKEYSTLDNEQLLSLIKANTTMITDQEDRCIGQEKLVGQLLIELTDIAQRLQDLER